MTGVHDGAGSAETDPPGASAIDGPSTVCVELPLRRFRWSRHPWLVTIDAVGLTVTAPCLRLPLVVPLSTIAGYCDSRALPETGRTDGMVLRRDPVLPQFQTKGGFSGTNLSVLYAIPHEHPVRRGHGQPRGLADGFRVGVVSPEPAYAALDAVGLRRFPTTWDGCVDVHGALPVAAMGPVERRWQARRTRVKRVALSLQVVGIGLCVVDRVLAESRWIWSFLVVTAVDFAALWLTVHWSRRDAERRGRVPRLPRTGG